MRLWSIHPEYLDSKGLVALWREGLLAQKVLLGKTTGYTKHPQLIRFKHAASPLGAIATYLRHVAIEAEKRGYNFDLSKIIDEQTHQQLLVSDGQINYEFQLLLNKLNVREPNKYQYLKSRSAIRLHPLFKQYAGDVEEWEVVA